MNLRNTIIIVRIIAVAVVATFLELAIMKISPN